MNVNGTMTLFRPAGPKELELIRASGYRAFPSRLPDPDYEAELDGLRAGCQSWCREHPGLFVGAEQGLHG